MKTSQLALTFATLVGLPCAAFAQQDAKEIQIKTTALSPGVAMLEGMGGNLGVSHGDDGVFLIDDQFAPMFPKIRAAIGELSKRPIRIVFNTHWHFDHTGGNQLVGEAGALIVAHDNVRKRMSAGQFMQMIGQQIPPAPHLALPVVTFAQSITFHLNGDTVEVLHLANAHTDGDAVLRFKQANVLHTGDLLVHGGYPVIDVDSGGSIDGLIAAQEKLLAMVDEQTKIIPGHGPLADKKALQAAHDLNKTLRDRIKKLVDEGKSIKEIQAAKPTAEFDEAMGKMFVKGDMVAAMIGKSLGAK